MRVLLICHSLTRTALPSDISVHLLPDMQCAVTRVPACVRDATIWTARDFLEGPEGQDMSQPVDADMLIPGRACGKVGVGNRLDNPAPFG